MSSLLDVPAQLALVLSLAASAASNDPAGVAGAAPPPQPAQAMLVVEPLDGPFRFGERNWLRTLKEDMGKEARHSARIFRTSGGRYYVPVVEERVQILNARREPGLAKRAAEASARRNARMLGAALNRAPTAGDLYIAHIFGPEAAVAFITLARSKPGTEVARQFPELMAVAPALARGEGGRLTLAEAYARLTAPLAAYETGAPLAARPVEVQPGERPAGEPQSAYARTTFVSGAIDWRPQVSAAASTASQ